MRKPGPARTRLAATLLLASISSLFGACELPAQEDLKVGVIQTFPLPNPQSDEAALTAHKKVLRAEVRVNPKMTIKFYEQPTDATVYNSTVSVERGERVIATYPVGKMIRHQALRLVHIVLLQTGESGSLVAEYEGGAVGAREGFAILRFSSSKVELHTLPLTDYGKVVIFKSNPDQLEVWSAAQDENVGAPIEDRPYITRACRWKSQGIVCGPAKRRPGVFTPGGISDPGIEIRP